MNCEESENKNRRQNIQLERNKNNPGKRLNKSNRTDKWVKEKAQKTGRKRKAKHILSTCTWNIRTTLRIGKMKEIDKEMEKNKVDLHEKVWRGNECV